MAMSETCWVEASSNTSRSHHGLFLGLFFTLIAKPCTCSVPEKKVIESYFGLQGKEGSKTLEYIGERIKLTRERVRQLKENSLGKMKTALHHERLRNYIGKEKGG